mgnify:FL=1
MDVSPKGIAVVKSFEGRALKAYRDVVGVWTIGYGNTNHDAFAVSYLGRQIGEGLTITEEQADFLLVESLRRNYTPAVVKAMPGARQQDTDAGASFHYNTGAIGRATWVKHWLAKNFASMTPALLSWNKAGGKEYAGLTRRRKRENAIIVSGDYGPEGVAKPPVLGADGRVKKEAPAPVAMPGLLSRGDHGPEVREVKESLALLGFKVDPATDLFDTATEAAVVSFQKAHKQLTVDGVVGPATRAAIQREADAKRKLGNTAKAGGAAGTGAGADQLAHDAWLPTWSLWLMAAVFVGAVAWFAWQYRDEISAFARRK